MEKKKFQLAAFAPSLLHLSLSDGVRTAWAGANIVFVLLGLILSVVCVRSRESCSIINIVSAAISVFWLLLMVGIVALALGEYQSHERAILKIPALPTRCR